MKRYDIVFSPTGGTKKVATLLGGALGGEVTSIDLTDCKQQFPTIQLAQEDAAIIAVPSYGGRVPAVATQRLALLSGHGARAILVCVYGNRAYEDTLVELEDVAKQVGFRVIAAVAAVAEHSIARQFAAGRPDAQDANSFLLLPDRSRPSSLQATLQSPPFPATVLTKRPQAQAWSPSPQRSVPSAASVRQNALCRLLTRKIPKR